MASPVLSRSPSTAAFAPGPHRRSHPNLQSLTALSLAPLTPKYPIDPADYNAYYDPTTSELHTSASLSQIATLPSPGGILTQSPVRSRDPSRTRKQRRIKSHVHIREPDQEQEQDREQEESQNQLRKSNTEPTDVIDHKSYHVHSKPKQSKSQSSLRLNRIKTAATADPSWLVQTGLSLTESSRETKGQSWISKRDSSTSLSLNLSSMSPDYFTLTSPQQRPGQTPRSGRNTPVHSRSRVPSRNASRSRLAGLTTDLRMTTNTSGATSPQIERGMKSASFVTAAELDPSYQLTEEDESQTPINIQPNWTDPKTQAELAAQLQDELDDDYDGDPYGVLDFEGHFDDSDGNSEEDEEEVRRAMSRYRIGGWMGLDGAIDALLRVEEVNDLEMGDGERSPEGLKEGAEGEGGARVEMPPREEEGNWGDVGWLGRLFGRSVGV